MRILLPIRGFKVARGFEDQEINLPERQTKNAAGYDFEAAKDVVIPTIWKYIFDRLCYHIKGLSSDYDQKVLKPTLVPTGVKAYMLEDEALFLYNRSSNPLKNFLLLGNGVGVVDSDYFENPDNDGHIMFQFINFGFFDKTIKKGDRIGQGIFSKFLKADDDNAFNDRQGGFGSTH